MGVKRNEGRVINNLNIKIPNNMPLGRILVYIGFNCQSMIQYVDALAFRFHNAIIY